MLIRDFKMKLNHVDQDIYPHLSPCCATLFEGDNPDVIRSDLHVVQSLSKLEELGWDSDTIPLDVVQLTGKVIRAVLWIVGDKQFVPVIFTLDGLPIDGI